MSSLRAELLFMYIGFVAAINGKRFYEKQYKMVLEHLIKKGHSIEHIQHLTPDEVNTMDPDRKRVLFDKFYKKLLHCDVIVTECSYEHITIGYYISYLLQNGKFVIALSRKDNHEDNNFFDEINEHENFYLYEYTDNELLSMLDRALADADPKLEKRFTIIFPALLMARLEEVARKKHIPKAVYIRELIEKDLK